VPTNGKVWGGMIFNGGLRDSCGWLNLRFHSLLMWTPTRDSIHSSGLGNITSRVPRPHGTHIRTRDVARKFIFQHGATSSTFISLLAQTGNDWNAQYPRMFDFTGIKRNTWPYRWSLTFICRNQVHSLFLPPCTVSCRNTGY